MSRIKELEKIAVTLECPVRGHLGSGALLEINRKFYILTAEHCLFPKSVMKVNISDFKIVSNVYGELPIDPSQFTLEKGSMDVVLLKVDETFIFNSYPLLKFTDDHEFPGLKFCFRGKPKSISGNTYTVYNCSMNGRTGSLLHIDIPSQWYTDFKGETGAEVLQGFSGSGLIIDNHEELILCGIVCSVSDDNFSGVNCISISDIGTYLNLEIKVEKLKDTVDIVKYDVNKIRNTLAKEIVRFAQENNNVAINNLTRKMDLFLPDWDSDDLEGFVSDMLIWDELYKGKIKGNPAFKALIEESNNELCSGNKKFIVKSSHEGNKYFHDIRKEFIGIVSNFLEEHKVWKKYINTVANGEIAKYLANCNLNFKD